VKRNEYAEPTEMAGVAEADTEMAYAWALDYDDPDEFPTQRLTPRRITSLGIAASLVTIAVAGAVALGVLRQPDPGPTPAPPATPAPTRAPTPEPTPTPPLEPTPTSPPTPAPCIAVAPQLIGELRSDARQMWADAGFTGRVTALAGHGNYVIGSQSRTAGREYPCDSDLTIGPA